MGESRIDFLLARCGKKLRGPGNLNGFMICKLWYQHRGKCGVRSLESLGAVGSA
jgi:hypothetical protein